MKKIIISVFLIVLTLLVFVKTDAANEKERKYASLPEITDSSFTNYGHLCGMFKEVNVLNSVDGNHSLKVVKYASTDFSFASVYYQSLGSKISALNVSDYVGMKITVYNDYSIPGNGLMFCYSGTEITNVEAHLADGSVNGSRDLDYVGYRNYVIPFGSIDPTTIGEFQIGIWGTAGASIYISQMELVYMGDISEEQPKLQRMSASLPEVNDGSYTNFGSSCDMYKEITTAYSADGKNAVKVVKNTSAGFSIASVYYQNLMGNIKDLNVSNYQGMRITVYNEKSIPGNGLMFAYSGAEITNIEAYTEYGTVLYSRDLDYTGYRTYYIPFASVNPENVWEFQIGIWGTAGTTIYISKVELVYMGYPVLPSNPNDDVNELFQAYYNDGVYTKNTNIYVNKDVLTETKSYFHCGITDLERTTYYNVDELWMTNAAGTINSGYGTSSEGMTHFKKENGQNVVDYTVKGTTMEDYYITLKDFKDSSIKSWEKVGNVYMTNDVEVLDMFRQFTAPLWLASEEARNYISFSFATVEVVDGNLVMKLWVESGDSGKLISTQDSMVLANKTYYVFSQAVILG